MLLGCIADDFTGASDLANTLAKGGMAATLFVGVPAERARPGCEAGVVALKSRTIPAPSAVRQSLQALDWLLAQGCRQIMFKYCSTFDSTPGGNIGPVAEALLDRLGGAALVCPAFPAVGRTLVHGHLFVDGRLLSETGMREHPLTPMTDPDIVRWLQRQTAGEVGLIPLATVRRGPEAIAQAFAGQARDGARLIVADAVGDEDLLALCEVAALHALVTGGSGIAIGLPENFRRTGLSSGHGSTFAPAAGPAAVLCGSCSERSLAQVEAYARDRPSLSILPDDLMSGAVTAAEAAEWALARIDRQPLIFSSAGVGVVRDAQERYGRDASAAAIERFMGETARALVERGVARLAVGGGETSGAVVSALGIAALSIGPEIDPGVPALSVEGRPLTIALKSGNFGAIDFFEKAATVLGQSSR